MVFKTMKGSKVVVKIGQVFHNWSVLSVDEIAQRSYCHCRCGRVEVVPNARLLAGKAVACKACLRKGSSTTHHGHAVGGSVSPTYASWTYLSRQRMLPEAWIDFQNFLVDMGEKPLGSRLKRLDDSKPHGPGNSHWA